MIFSCPACDAGHTVPVSMIPNGGLDMTCRRCGAVFSARAAGAPDLSEDASSDTVRGVAPFSDAEPTVDAADGPQMATQPLDAAQVTPLGPDEEGSPELTDTRRMNEHTLPVPEVQAMPVPEPRDKTPVLHMEFDAPTESGSLYDRVEAGEYAPEPPEPNPDPEARDPGPKAWNEPSNPDLARLGPLPRLAEGLNRAPLPLKVALLVFPAALGLTLVLTAGKDQPIQIPAPPARAARPRPTPPRPPPPAAERLPAAEPEPPEMMAEGSPLDDRPAPAGYFYVQPRRAPVRSVARESAPPIARLTAGQLVRQYEKRGPWVLVLVEPDGPGGFVLSSDLGPSKPIRALAADLAFEQCRSGRRGGRAACFDRAQTQLGDCRLDCGTGAEATQVVLRCEEACNLAFEICRRGCDKRRRRR